MPRRLARAALLGLALSPLLLRPARAQEPAPVLEWRAAAQRADEAKDPRAALAMEQAFLKAHPNLVAQSPYHAALVYERMALLQRHWLKDLPGALATLDEGLGRLGKSFERFILIGLKGEFLFSSGQAAEAVALLGPELERAEAEDPRRISYIVLALAPVLQAQNKGAEAAAMLLGVQKRHLGAAAHYPFEWMPRTLLPALLKAGSAEEALSWAKLFWMAAPFKEADINDATQRLAQAWLACDLSPAKSQAFLKAQEDAKAPNPLAQVPRPALKPEEIQAQIAGLRPDQTHEKITLLMLLGDWHQAMLEARSQMIANMEDPRGALQVCRVFKARDLNLARANAFLQFLKDGAGENPVAAFLKENPKKEAPAQ